MRPPTKIEQYLAVSTAGGPTWHPNGDYIAFAYNETGIYQIFSIKIQKDIALWPRRLTYEEDRCTDPRYLSDGTLLFIRDRGGNENYQIGLLDTDFELTWLTSNLEAKHRICYSTKSGYFFNANLIDNSRLDTYYHELPLKDNEAELLYEPEKGIGQVKAISPDGKKAIIWLVLGNVHQDLLLFDLETHEVENLTHSLSGINQFRWEVVRWIDNHHVLVASDFDSDLLRLAILSLSGEFTTLDEIESNVKYEVETSQFCFDSQYTYFVNNVEGYSEINRAIFRSDGVDVMEEINLPFRGVLVYGDWRTFNSGMKLSPNGRYLAVTYSSSTQPSNIWIHDLETKQSWKATESNMAGLKTKDFARASLFHFNSFDDLRVPYFRYLPHQHSGKAGYPAILIIHGGPESQIRPKFDPVIQCLLSAGFAIITPNIRGSKGYGKTYVDLDNVEKRLDAILDITHLALHIKNTDSTINGNRLVIFGGSYGGFAVLSAMTEHPEIWKAGVDIVGISNFVTFLQNTASWRRSIREAEYGSLEHDMETLVRISPIHKAENISAPLFIIQGDNDERVPLSESIQIFDLLKKKGLPVQFLRFADEGHGLAKLENRIQAYNQVIEWLKEIV
jgi:dipeptidyl aminopeptidase/acylaminoacyl peptidase